MPRTLTLYRPGVVGYTEGMAFQRSRLDDLHGSGEDGGALVLLEHPPVITIGRSGTDRNILAPAETLEREGVTVRETNRGGDVTYHGPGQLVGYPIVPLAFHGKDVHAYLRRLESFLIALLEDYGIAACRRKGLTGVWTDAGKIVSIGVAVSHWITWHGFALNVAPNLDHFGLIRPCGLTGVRITSMEELLGAAPGMDEVSARLVERFCESFSFDTVIEKPMCDQSGEAQ